MSLPLLLQLFCFFFMTCNYFILLYFYTIQKNNLPFYVNFLVTFYNMQLFMYIFCDFRFTLRNYRYLPCYVIFLEL